MGGRGSALVVAGVVLSLAGCGQGAGEPTATATVTQTVTTQPEPTPAPTGPSSPASAPASSVSPSFVASPSETLTASPPPPPSTSPDAEGVPRTYDAALAHFDAWGSEPVPVRRFQSPSGNIYCLLRHDLYPTGCEIREGAVRDAAVCAGSPSSQVGRIVFDRRRAVPVCNSDTFWEPGAPVLQYGEAARVRGGDVMCLSETIGVTCISTSRTEGFFLRRGEYVVFNAG